MIEEASLASALGLDSNSDAKIARRLLQLHAGALQGESRRSQEVGPTPYSDSYYLILDMNGLLLEKRPSSNGRDRLFSLLRRHRRVPRVLCEEFRGDLLVVLQ